MAEAAKIRFICPHCNKHFKLDAHYAGRKAKCSKCSAVIRVPNIIPSTDSNEYLVLNKDSSIAETASLPARNKNNGVKKDKYVRKEKMYCPTCGGQLRQILKQKQPIGKSICIRCSVTPGFCPECHGALRTKLAQQCPHCLSSWHLTVSQSSSQNQMEKTEPAKSQKSSTETKTQKLHEQAPVYNPAASFFSGAITGLGLWGFGFLALLINIWPFTFALFMNSQMDPTETVIGQFASKISKFATSGIYLTLGPVSIIGCAILGLIAGKDAGSGGSHNAGT